MSGFTGGTAGRVTGRGRGPHPAQRGISESAWMEEAVRERIGGRVGVSRGTGPRRETGTPLNGVPAKVPVSDPLPGDVR